MSPLGAIKETASQHGTCPSLFNLDLEIVWDPKDIEDIVFVPQNLQSNCEDNYSSARYKEQNSLYSMFCFVFFWLKQQKLIFSWCGKQEG